METNHFNPQGIPESSPTPNAFEQGLGRPFLISFIVVIISISVVLGWDTLKDFASVKTAVSTPPVQQTKQFSPQQPTAATAPMTQASEPNRTEPTTQNEAWSKFKK